MTTKLIAGLDEVGMGCIAGPVVIVVAAFQQDEVQIDEVTDSKELTAQKREDLVHPIAHTAQYLNFGWATNTYIDKYGMVAAWQKAATSALEGAPDFEILLVDGTREVEGFKGQQETIIKGDLKEWQIGAASIVAKVIRDREMIYFHNYCPHYRWNANVGYGTKAHYQLIKEKGPCWLHRQTFLKKFFSRQFWQDRSLSSSTP